ncbi:MAG TPA: SulP family inorganic anion transporter [Microlunatus sp.]|nr:SulP family inorganic anion transporter [Microlunatus sp.]
MNDAQAVARHSRLRRYVPILDWLRRYDRRWLRADLLAGCVVAALAVPQSLGYAAIAGVPVEIGLYAVPVALLAYAVFGTSRQLVIGPVSTVSVLSGSLVAALHPVNVAQAVLFTTAAALWVGIILVVAAQLRIGWVAEFLSKPIVTGFVLGLTVLVILGELPALLGIQLTARDVLGRISGLITHVGAVDPLTAVISLVSLAILFVGSRLVPVVPWSLVVLVLGLAVSRVLDLAARGVAVVGVVPSGLPVPSLPLIPLQRLPDIVLAAGALAFVGLAEGLSAARLFAVKGDYRIRTDQELFAVGASNLAVGLTGGMAVAGSLSKTAAVDRAGGRSQVAGIAAAVLSLLAILFLAPTLGLLPRAVLSAIVVHAVWGLIDLPAMRRYRHSRRIDFVSACVAAVGVLAAGPLLGLLIAVGWAILGLVYRSSRVTIDVMGKVPGEKAAWGALENHPERVTIPGVLVLRLNESLFWVNAARVKERVLELVDQYPRTRALVLDLESTDQLEITSADMLTMLLQRLRSRGVDLYLVRVRFRVRIVLRNTGMRAQLGDDHLWHSISQGVRAARNDHGLKLPKPAAPTSEPSGPAEIPGAPFAQGAGPMTDGSGPGTDASTGVATASVTGGPAPRPTSGAEAGPARGPEPIREPQPRSGTVLIDRRLDDQGEDVMIDEQLDDDDQPEIVLGRSLPTEPDRDPPADVPTVRESRAMRKKKHKKVRHRGKKHH